MVMFFPLVLESILEITSSVYGTKQHPRPLQLAVPCRGFGLGAGADKTSLVLVKRQVRSCSALESSCVDGSGSSEQYGCGESRAGRGCGMDTPLGGPLLISLPSIPVSRCPPNSSCPPSEPCQSLEVKSQVWKCTVVVL